MIRTDSDVRAHACCVLTWSVAVCAMAAYATPRAGIAQRTPDRSALRTLEPSSEQVVLKVRPSVGDTLYMRMDQTFEMTTLSASGAPAAPPITVTVGVCTHAVVMRRTPTDTELLSTTDSVILTPASAASMPFFAQAKRSLDGRTVRLRVATDGAITVLDDAAGGRHSGQRGDEQHVQPHVQPPVSRSAASAGSLMQMPAMLPKDAVRVGDTWTRSFAMPATPAQLGVPAGRGHVHATFRLDSLSADRSIAYVSLQASVVHDSVSAARNAPHDDDRGREATGTMTGTMQIDRRLEWMTDSRTTVNLVSKIRTTPGGPLTSVRMKVTQRLRAMPKR